MPNPPPPQTPHSREAVDAEAVKLQARLGDNFETFLHDLLQDAKQHSGDSEASPELDELFKRQAFRNLAEFKLRVQNGYKLAIDELTGDAGRSN